MRGVWPRATRLVGGQHVVDGVAVALLALQDAVAARERVVREWAQLRLGHGVAGWSALTRTRPRTATLSSTAMNTSDCS